MEIKMVTFLKPGGGIGVIVFPTPLTDKFICKKALAALWKGRRGKSYAVLATNKTGER